MANKLFISYRRKSWAFTHRMAEELERRLDAEIFVDLASIDEADFERSILKHLHESDAVLLVVSEHTFTDRINKDDDWVRREIREALEHNIPVVLIAVEGLYPPSGLPEDIKDVARSQGIAFYPEFFAPACDRLADFVVKIGAAHHLAPSAPSVVPATPPASLDNKRIEGQSSLYEALDLLEEGDFDKGTFILKELLEQGFKTRVIDIQAVLEDAYAEQERAERIRFAKLDYEEITLLAKNRFTQRQAFPAWQQWCEAYPDLVETLDAENLREKLKTGPMVFDFDTLEDVISPPLQFSLPEPFAWVQIPAGQVTLEDNMGTFDVPPFQIAKYPVTVAQYELFMEEDGYQNSDYWTQTGWQWREEENVTLPWAWNDEEWQALWQPNHPMVGVSWYEAYAFSQWLATNTGLNINLPTEQQWQRAAEGNERFTYPWGDEWDSSRCNNDVDGQDWQKKKATGNMTSSVLKYERHGDSSFGVVDMAGNVWEWCLTDYDTASNSDVENVNRGRVLRGGSWVTGNSDGFPCAFRDRVDPGYRYSSWGFRLALS